MKRVADFLVDDAMQWESTPGMGREARESAQVAEYLYATIEHYTQRSVKRHRRETLMAILGGGEEGSGGE